MPHRLAERRCWDDTLPLSDQSASKRSPHKEAIHPRTGPSMSVDARTPSGDIISWCQSVLCSTILREGRLPAAAAAAERRAPAAHGAVGRAPRVALDVLFSSLARAQGQTAQGQVAVCAVLPLRSLKRTMLVTGRVGGLGGVGRTHRRVMPQRGDGLPQGPAEPARWRDTRVVERALQLVCHVLRVERARQRLRPPLQGCKNLFGVIAGFCHRVQDAGKLLRSKVLDVLEHRLLATNAVSGLWGFHSSRPRPPPPPPPPRTQLYNRSCSNKHTHAHAKGSQWVQTIAQRLCQ